MTNQTRQIVFSGLDGKGPSGIPEWYEQLTTVPADPPTFIDAIRELERATKAPLAYLDPELLPASMDELSERVGEMADDRPDTVEEFLRALGVVETEHYRALVNPDWLGEDGLYRCRRDDAMWHPPTRAYAPVNPVDAYGPLLAVTRQANGREASAFGQVREYDHGAEVHMDVFFPELTVQIPRGPELVLGLTSGYDFRGRRSHYAHVIAANPHARVVYRRLYDGVAKSRRHVGAHDGSEEHATSDIAGWWHGPFAVLDAAGEPILSVVADAMDYTVPLGLIGGAVAAYEANGFPEYLAEAAAERAKQYRTAGPPSAFELFTGAAEALQDEFDGKDASSTTREYTKAANRWLFNPANAEDRALLARQRFLAEQATLPDGTTPGTETAIEERRTELADNAERARSLSARMRDIMEAADDEAEGASA